MRRHFWRYVTFSEMSELYASRLMRMLAINIAVVFMAVFLYQNGYSLPFIMGYWGIFFLYKALIAVPAAAYAARFGPKHGILLSNILYIPSMIVFPFVPDIGWPALVFTLVFQGFSSALYDLCYKIDFSKVKSADHAGKEIALMNIIEKLAKGISPFLGGLLAFVAGPQATLWSAAALFLLASLPLLKTGEPIKTHQKLVIRKFPWRIACRSLLAEIVVGFDAATSGVIWSLFIVVAVLHTSGDAVYAELGALLSVVLLATLAASYVFGKIIDSQKGGYLLKYSVLMDGLVHMLRPFAVNPMTVAGINVANETATTGYMMAYLRGLFDTADRTQHRVTFLGFAEASLNFGAAIAAGAVAGLMLLFGDIEGMKILFFIAGIAVLGILIAKFQLYKK
jgi:MFS family permease